MKLIKYAVALAIINAIVMTGLVMYMGKKNEAKQNAIPQQLDTDTDNSATPPPTILPSVIPSTNTVQSPAAKPSAIVKPSVVSAPSPTPVTDNRCIIKIDGVSYDVTQFRRTHPGGNIFRRGADMSADFWKQHGQKELNKVQQYRI